MEKTPSVAISRYLAVAASVRLELVHVAVRVAEAPGLAQPDAVDDRRVIELVGDDRVLLVEQRLEEAAVGVEAGAEEDRVVGAEKRGQTLFELAVERLRPADEAHRRHPVAPAFEGLVCGLDHRRMAREAEVVVGAQVEELPSVDADVRALRRAHHVLGLVEPGLAHFCKPAHQVVAQCSVHGPS
jgi:hypothetical protein